MTFLANFQWKMLRDSVNIDDLFCNPVVLEKKLVKSLKVAAFMPDLHRKQSEQATPKMKNGGIFAEIKKKNHITCFNKM